MEKYTEKQAEDEARAMTDKLNKLYPEQQGVFTSEQYDQVHQSETDEIYKTAIGTVAGLATLTNIEPAKKIWELLGGNDENESFAKKTAGKPHLVELRYKCSDLVIRGLAESDNIRQVVELASGFTPHAQELLGDRIVDLYIESDLQINIRKKKEINSILSPGINVSYVPGNLYDHELWKDLELKLKEGPVVIFSEGFMLYTTKLERDKLAQEVEGILRKHGGYFIFEDSTRFHPEFIAHENFRPFFEKLSQVSNRDMGPISQDEMTKEWESRGFSVDRVPEDIELSCEKTLPDISKEIELIKKNYMMWKLSLKNN